MAYDGDPSVDWELDYHHPRGVSPLGFVWVEDGYAQANQWAAEAVGAPHRRKEVRVFGAHVYYRHTQVAVSGGRPNAESVLHDFASSWPDAVRAIRRRRQALESRVARAQSNGDLLFVMQQARDYQLRMWRLHFLVLYAFLEELDTEPQSGGGESRRTQTEVEAYLRRLEAECEPHDYDSESVLEFCRREGDRYVLAPDPCRPILSESPWWGRHLVGALPPADMVPRPSADDLGSMSGNTPAMFEWWYESHNTEIEWRAGLPLRNAAMRLGSNLGIEPILSPFLFWDELVALGRDERSVRGMGRLLLARRHFMEAAGTSDFPKDAPVRHGSVIAGTSGAPGVAAGVVERLSEVGESMPQAGSVILCRGAVPGSLGALAAASAILVIGGSRWSHVAIMARALNIPCVVGLPEGVGGALESEVVLVDGGNGSVTRM